MVAAIKTQLASEVASTGARKGLDQTDVEKTQGLAANVPDGGEAEGNVDDEEPKDDEAADDQGPGDGGDNVQDEDEQDEDRLSCSRVALSLLADMLSAEEARSRLTSDGIFPVLGSLLQWVLSIIRALGTLHQLNHWICTDTMIRILRGRHYERLTRQRRKGRPK